MSNSFHNLSTFDRNNGNNNDEVFNVSLTEVCLQTSHTIKNTIRGKSHSQCAHLKTSAQKRKIVQI